MSNPPINASDPIFEKHALYIFKALQTVQTCIVASKYQRTLFHPTNNPTL